MNPSTSISASISHYPKAGRADHHVLLDNPLLDNPLGRPFGGPLEVLIQS